MTLDRQIDINESRHFNADQRAWDKMGDQLDTIDRYGMIGQVIRNGKTVFYFSPTGSKSYFESQRESEVKAFIMRNGWA